MMSAHFTPAHISPYILHVNVQYLLLALYTPLVPVYMVLPRIAGVVAFEQIRPISIFSWSE
jgi:hypothetical protein